MATPQGRSSQSCNFTHGVDNGYDPKKLEAVGVGDGEVDVDEHGPGDNVHCLCPRNWLGNEAAAGWGIIKGRCSQQDCKWDKKDLCDDGGRDHDDVGNPPASK